ncbi:hypothetical protein BO99DRAFT_410595 [Aspergillus violaceofuscus CBS 115571]|uniref:C2H2-type domain-containing protein n=1 Tax=Aspergillus violaceofuscus (strain CBS 115571) TaxID=1450538 RepID=A0A2V5IP35_ASPV1|nr:hypothetical protein BO99DRAFT_410595 [Aspergillus violaceofuscus CBS 115571]
MVERPEEQIHSEMMSAEEGMLQEFMVESVPSDLDGYSDLKCEICHNHQHPVQGTLLWRCSRCNGMHHDECVVSLPEFHDNGAPTRFGCTRCGAPWFLRSELCCAGNGDSEDDAPEGDEGYDGLDWQEQHEPLVTPEVQQGRLCLEVATRYRLDISEKHFICELFGPGDAPCEQRFSCKVDIESHQKIHHSGGPTYPCPHCPLWYRSDSGIRSHLKARHGTDPAKCGFCRFTAVFSVVNDFQVAIQQLRRLTVQDISYVFSSDALHQPNPPKTATRSGYRTL